MQQSRGSVCTYQQAQDLLACRRLPDCLTCQQLVCAWLCPRICPLPDSNLHAAAAILLRHSMRTQTTYAYRMALQTGLSTAGDAHLRWHAKRSADVFRIFRAAFAAKSRQAALVAVMAVQSGSGSLQLQLLRDTYSQPADALAIAPYFGFSLNDEVYALGANATIDQVLDLARTRVVKDTYATTYASATVAASFGIPLVAYEGGQHMGGGGSTCGSDSCANVDWLQGKLQNANRDWRMGGLYDNMLRCGNNTWLVAVAGGSCSWWRLVVRAASNRA